MNDATETAPEKCREIFTGCRVGCDYREPPEHQPWIHPAHRGTVLAVDDPRAWRNTLAFPSEAPPTVQDVQQHLAKLAARGIHLKDKVPVSWDFGAVYWERESALYVAPAAVIPIKVAA